MIAIDPGDFNFIVLGEKKNKMRKVNYKASRRKLRRIFFVTQGRGKNKTPKAQSIRQ